MILAFCWCLSSQDCTSHHWNISYRRISSMYINYRCSWQLTWMFFIASISYMFFLCKGFQPTKKNKRNCSILHQEFFVFSVVGWNGNELNISSKTYTDWWTWQMKWIKAMEFTLCKIGGNKQNNTASVMLSHDGTWWLCQFWYSWHLLFYFPILGWKRTPYNRNNFWSVGIKRTPRSWWPSVWFFL